MMLYTPIYEVFFTQNACLAALALAPDFVQYSTCNIRRFLRATAVAAINALQMCVIIFRYQRFELIELCFQRRHVRKSGRMA